MCVYRYAYKGDWDGVGVYHLYAVGGAVYFIQTGDSALSNTYGICASYSAASLQTS